MTDRQTAILESLDEDNYHQAEMLLKSTISRFAKDKRWDTIDGLIKNVLGKLASKPKTQIREVSGCNKNGNMIIGLLEHYSKNAEDSKLPFDPSVLSTLF